MRKAIGRHGDFQISAKFLFSDFETWADGHNAGFDYLIDAAGRDMCVFDVDESGLTLVEIAPGLTVDDVKKVTDADFLVADPNNIPLMEEAEEDNDIYA